MDSTTFATLALSCAPAVHLETAKAIVAVESSFNPYAIGIVGGVLERQPRHLAEAIATARALQAEGRNFSVGLGQINISHFKRLGLTTRTSFDPCTNLGALQRVLAECFGRALSRNVTDSQPQRRLRRALSCYYSGSFLTGFQHGYVRKVMSAAAGISREAAKPASNDSPKEKT